MGWGLSGGEAHRVALARTFLGRAPLLLLDEPTAHLDAASEAEIIAVIARLARPATTIIATHSPHCSTHAIACGVRRGHGTRAPATPMLGAAMHEPRIQPITQLIGEVATPSMTARV